MTDWLAAAWPAPAGVHAGTTLRGGGVSAGAYRSLNLGGHVGDDAAAVAENRRRVRQRRDLPQEPRWLAQVHGTTVARLPATQHGEPRADAAVTSADGVVCAVLTADCLPVAFAAADGSAIGIAHAGWRGLAAGVLEATLQAFGRPARDVLAWLGPAISQAAFEVGDEVRAAFVAAAPEAARCFERNARGRWQADLHALARQRLTAAGVQSIHGGRRCTYGEAEDFFSFRRDGRCGRMATLVWRG